jgi:opacity protein-like surface antigen
MCTVIAMDDSSLPEVRRLVAEANAARWQRRASGGAAGADVRQAERRLDDLFGISHTLAIYGTLAPGSPTIT